MVLQRSVIPIATLVLWLLANPCVRSETLVYELEQLPQVETPAPSFELQQGDRHVQAQGATDATNTEFGLTLKLGVDRDETIWGELRFNFSQQRYRVEPVPRKTD